MYQELGSANRVRVQAGHAVFDVGDSGDSAYLVEDGTLVVINPTSGLRMGVINAGELFGEIALIDCRPRTATVVALTDATLIEIRHALVAELLEDADPVIRLLLRLVLQRFRSNIDNSVAIAAEDSAENSRLTHEVRDRLKFLSDIVAAVKREEFVLYYQPIFRLPERKCAGYEALIRWHHPELGIVPPGKFLGLAEESGVIRAIGQWTLEQGCRDWPLLRSTTDDPDPFISINVSGKQLTEERFADEVISLQQRLSIPPRELKLELTETSVIKNAHLAQILLRRFHAHGNRIALDDYGTGYSGLDHLQQFPFTTLKLDQSFVRNIYESSLSFQLVMSSIDMAKSLRLEIIAEGIESPDVARVLTELGCDFAQGFLFAKPQPLGYWLDQSPGSRLPAT